MSTHSIRLSKITPFNLNVPIATRLTCVLILWGGDNTEDVCGICRIPFDGCCPDCWQPGDACPIVWGKCSHVFHGHCILKWLRTEHSRGQCPMDRQTWGMLNKEIMWLVGTNILQKLHRIKDDDYKIHLLLEKLGN